MLDGDDAGRQGTDEILRRLARHLWLKDAHVPDGSSQISFRLTSCGRCWKNKSPKGGGELGGHGNVAVFLKQRNAFLFHVVPKRISLLFCGIGDVGELIQFWVSNPEMIQAPLRA